MIMNTHCKVLFGAMAFVVASFSGSIAELTVNNGTASGDENGTLVTVTAAPAPAGTHFVGWTGDIAILADPSLPKTTATIPFMAVTITATYTAPAANSLPVPSPATPASPAANSVSTLGPRWDG